MEAPNSGASQEAIEFHYDMPANFFALWLGKSMTYTAARYADPAMSLDLGENLDVDPVELVLLPHLQIGTYFRRSARPDEPSP